MNRHDYEAVRTVPALIAAWPVLYQTMLLDWQERATPYQRAQLYYQETGTAWFDQLRKTCCPWGIVLLVTQIALHANPEPLLLILARLMQRSDCHGTLVNLAVLWLIIDQYRLHEPVYAAYVERLYPYLHIDHRPTLVTIYLRWIEEHIHRSEYPLTSFTVAVIRPVSSYAQPDRGLHSSRLFELESHEETNVHCWEIPPAQRELVSLSWPVASATVVLGGWWDHDSGRIRLRGHDLVVLPCTVSSNERLSLFYQTVGSRAADTQSDFYYFTPASNDEVWWRTRIHN